MHTSGWPATQTSALSVRQSISLGHLPETTWVAANVLIPGRIACRTATNAAKCPLEKVIARQRLG
jgi:hypothetical protein